METVTQNEAIGVELAFNVDEDDELSVSTEQDELEVTVLEINNRIPVNEGDETELICKPHEENLADDEVVILYARVTKIEETRAEYDLYAHRLIGASTEELGSIVELKVE